MTFPAARFLLAASVPSWLAAADLQVIQMAGVYDFDRDQLTEFLTLEEGKRQGVAVTLAGFYEVDAMERPQLLWKFETPLHVRGTIVDSRPADLEGDGLPEIVVAVNVPLPNRADLFRGLLYIFRRDGGSFAASPSLTYHLSDPTAAETINNFRVVDLEGDGKDDLIVSLQGARRRIVTLQMTGEGSAAALKGVADITLDRFAGSGSIPYVAQMDANRDGYDDVVAYSAERNVLRVQPFLNRRGQFTAGGELLQRVPGMSDPIFRSVAVIDWNRDGRDDLIVPFRSGHLVSVTLDNQTAVARELGIDAGSLSDLQPADFNQDGFTDLLLVNSQEGKITVLYGGGAGEVPVHESFAVGGRQGQLLSVLPESADGTYLGTVIGGGWTGTASEIFYFELGQPPRPAQQAVADTYVPPSQVEETAPSPRKSTEGKTLPSGILPTYVLPVSQTFAYTIPEEPNREFFSFRWVSTPPRGMYFHFETQSIEWVPDAEQLGAYELAFAVKMKVGETVDLVTAPDGTVTYQVVPELSTVEQRFWVYVNDPPSIASAPPMTEFVAGAEFLYPLKVADRNPDTRITYTVERGPVGMTVTPAGAVRWLSGPDDIAIHEVRLVVSDGFDRDVQSFKLFSRGRIVVTSLPETYAVVGQSYRYAVQARAPEEMKKDLAYALISAPRGMTIDHTGLVQWTPQAAQIDTQAFAVIASHGISADTQRVKLFVNHPPIVKKEPATMTAIALGDTFEFALEGADPNRNDRVRFEPLDLPPGMRIDPSTGRLRWVPTIENLDFSGAEVRFTDGRESVDRSYDFFVNAPIRITSSPPLLATTGQPFLYPIATDDPNRGVLLPYAHLTAISDRATTRLFSITIEDDVFRENAERYIGEFHAKKSILITSGKESTGDTLLSRTNLKKFVQTLFYEDQRIVLVLQEVEGRSVTAPEVLWHLFEGGKGTLPKVSVEELPTIRISLVEFPDGMTVDELSGTVSWTPTPAQAGVQTVSVVASDGFTRAEQRFQVYANHPPAILSTPPMSADVGETYSYSVTVEDRNADRELSFELLKAPKGMQISRAGKIGWIPTASQINARFYSVRVSDGYAEAVQDVNVFVNIPPAVLTAPKPVALSGFEYRYRIATEDLNGDKIQVKATMLPKFATFDEKTGLLRWKPRLAQKGANPVAFSVTDARGAETLQEFDIHVFEDPSSQQFVSTSWPLLLAFVGAMFTIGVTASQ